jgi:peptidoglycan/xylan/chitin deacetylase (PgdA/CDA1 family)
MVKSLLIRLLVALGLPGLFRRLNRRSLTILLYHGVAPKADFGIYNYRGKFITPEVFSMELAYLKKHYTVLDLDEAVEKLRNGTLPPNSVVITFDDGYKNFYEYAFPLLKQHGLSATFFLPTDFVLNKIPLWIDRLEYLGFENDNAIRQQLKNLSDEQKNLELEKLEASSQKKFLDFSQDRYVYSPIEISEIKEMQEAGMKFGAHTASHPILSKVSKDKLVYEITDSKNLLEQNIGEISKVFCYPNGQPEDFNEDVLEEIKTAGFTSALTTLEETNNKTSNPYLLKRITLDNIKDERTFAFTVSGLRAFLRKLI